MENILIEKYKGKKIFLTGHTGFKGSWLLKILNQAGAEVMGYALAPEQNVDLFNVIQGESLGNSIIGDLRDKQKLKEAVSSFQPDFVFHLAAQPLVRLSYQIPSETFEVNAIGTANVLDAVRLLEKPCSIVLITTDKVYYNNEWTYPYRENDRLGGYDPYSASKACTELVIDSYRNSFFNIDTFRIHHKGLAVARAGNVIGGGDWSKDRLIPDIVRALSQKETITIRNPHSIRPWQHVLEPLLGYLKLGIYLSENVNRYSQAYNFGPDAADSLPVSKMVELSISHWGHGNYEVIESANQPHEAGLLKLDISKAKAELDWHPLMTATEAIKDTIEWYKEYFEAPKNIVAFTEMQIERYLWKK
ncbi:MAG: CDP-glucose 4,6-dehydratase [Pseudopedobacter saltans]|uniref:CDP-glucose 4,6-dehydratase n=1 Tax=Pseudopedobacter saltans TaxID=151895 RepID=A0A2W5F7Y8_9SPHI|nr:MAG: CDP-glucose 4,6-dehydratase [Pseudopedobacter saltans]